MEFMKYPKVIKHKRKIRKVELRKGYWKRMADQLQSKIVRKIGKCEWCGSGKNLQACHVVSRANLRLRYSMENLMCLCAACHLKWHHDPLESMLWFNEMWPERVDYLRVHKQEITKMTIDDYKKLIADLENYI
jgi:5-methylcytosine-specific restriction endonuclease McrA